MRQRLAMSLCALLWSLAAAAAPSPHLTDVREETLTARDGSVFELMRARVQVPESRARPDGPQIELAVVRIHRSTAPACTAHVLLAGGPGDSGVRVALVFAAMLSPAVVLLVRAQRDYDRLCRQRAELAQRFRSPAPD